MIKIFKGMYIHFLTVALFLVCFITGKSETLFITYLIMTVHELSHLAAAVGIGLKPSHIVFYPFGVNLKLKNKMVCSLADEIILYMSGPLANIVMAIGARLFFEDFFWFRDFYYKNLALFAINLLPILPLDGGIIMKKIIGWWIGYRRGVAVMRGISFAMISLVIVALYKIDIFKYNFSVYFFLVFLVCNLFTAKEKYNVNVLKELMFSDELVKKRKTKVLVAKKGENLRDVLKDFTNSSYNIVCFIGENGEIIKIMSQREVINTLLTN